MNQFVEKTVQARLTTLLLLVVLTLTFLLETWWLALEKNASTSTMLVVMVIKVLPLLFFLHPIQQGRPLSGIWLALLLMPYLCLAILGSWAPGAEGRFALFDSALILACCSSAMLLTRWQKKAADAHAEAH